MKKFALLIILVFAALSLPAQNRKKIAHYSLFQQYFNPALTGYEGSVVKAFFRDQWVGFEDAPRTVFISGELNLSDVGARANRRPMARLKHMQSNHHVGAWVLRDTFGPFKDTQFNLGYASRIPLTKRLGLRAGAALAYDMSSLDLAKVTIDNMNDPQYQRLFTSDNNQLYKMDVNAGLALTGQDFYMGYAIQDLARGRLSVGEAYLNRTYSWHHVLQGGYRKALTDEFGLVLTGIYRYDNRLKESLEGQLKGVWNNTFWLGGGYRKDLALTFNSGLRLNQLRVGYAREIVTGKAGGINAGTNELMLTYNLVPVRFPKKRGHNLNMSIW